MKQLTSVLLLFFLHIGCSQAQSRDNYPASWWKKIPEDQRRSWEKLPQDAADGEVILSKRTELGIFSNFGHTPFRYQGTTYASVEGFWQMMKYPDPTDKKDPRHKLNYPFTRSQISQMHGFQAKKAGDAANKLMKESNINWISYKGKRFNYKDGASGSKFHTKLITDVITEKVYQNSNVKDLLRKTKGLMLVPDHNVGTNRPGSYYYHRILMTIRKKL